MSVDISKKIGKEKAVSKLMIDIYYRHHEGQKNEREELIGYVFERIDKCPFIETKSFCSKCKVHCYREDKRELIRKIMRYSGPRMIIYHPILLLKHMILG